MEIFEIFLYPNFQWVFFGTILFGFVSGMIGTIAVLQKQSLVGDAMAHAALPGICIGFLLAGEKNIILMIFFAGVFGYLALYLIQYIMNHSKIKEDASIGIILTLFFSIGILLLTFISNGTFKDKAGLNQFIFGQAASLMKTDIFVYIVVSILLIVFLFLFFKEIKLAIFDPNFALSIGYPLKQVRLLLQFMLVITIVVGIQSVGVILMSALLIIPGISARFWSGNVVHLVIIGGILGAISGSLGAFTSTIFDLPTGPVIVLILVNFFLISFFFGKVKGLFRNKKWQHIKSGDQHGE